MRRSIRVIAFLALAFAAADISDHRVLAQDQGQGPARVDKTGLYIVQMADLPAVTYADRLPPDQVQRSGRMQKVDLNSPVVAGYAGYLNAQHDEALGGVGGGRKVYDYRYSFNGFAAQLSDAQAERLKTQPGVLSVTKDEMRFADTSSTPAFLGLDAPGGLWDQLGGVGGAGEGIIIGVVDSGIWPESTSFINRAVIRGKSKEPNFAKIVGWNGRCESGEQFTPSKCNGKIVGARHFNEAWGGDAGLKAERPWEFASPRDYNGHGTHTSSTAGGNNAVSLGGSAAVFGRISGIAPRARIAAYKALWSTEDASTASGFTSDLVAAIDQAVADGVDVINYSISGSTTNFLDPAEVAFLFAADAGVFVAASAGNSGPTSSTVAHPSPWITTVAAGTHNRNGSGAAWLGNNVSYPGASLASAPVAASLIDSTTAGLPGADATAVRLCFSAADNGGTPVLDPALITGKIVVCDRGTTARVSKSLAVRDAGGVGMILVNVTPNSQNADLHSVPTVHLSDVDRAAVKAYAAASGATARIEKATIVFDVAAPFTAAFSSRGPLIAGAGDLLKPDLIAPGQDIVAAVAPPGNGGQSFGVYSGTSMSSPHVAGLAALLKNLHPDWTPMMIKSALMTSASDVLDGPNTNSTVIFRQGAGHVAPNRAADPGLVYDSDFLDWLAFLCGTTTGVDPATCSALEYYGYSLDPSDFNGASIAVGSLAGVQTVWRRVTNVGAGAATYTASTTGLAGFTVAVDPASLTLAPGDTGWFSVTITRTTATLGAYAGGQLTWTDGTHAVRSPMVVRPVALAAPVQVSSAGGPTGYNVTFGYSGTFGATPRGLVPAATTNGSVDDDPGDAFDPTGPGVLAIPVVIASGTTYARFSLFDANVSPASDVDLYVYRGATLVGISAGGTSSEEVSFVSPIAGDYTVYVHGFAVPGTANLTLFSWLLGSADAGNMTVSAPASATIGGSGPINLTFSGLASATKYLGSVLYTGTTGMPNPTIVRVDTP